MYYRKTELELNTEKLPTKSQGSSKGMDQMYTTSNQVFPALLPCSSYIRTRDAQIILCSNTLSKFCTAAAFFFNTLVNILIKKCLPVHEQTTDKRTFHLMTNLNVPVIDYILSENKDRVVTGLLIVPLATEARQQ